MVDLREHCGFASFYLQAEWGSALRLGVHCGQWEGWRVTMCMHASMNGTFQPSCSPSFGPCFLKTAGALGSRPSRRGKLRLCLGLTRRAGDNRVIPESVDKVLKTFVVARHIVLLSLNEATSAASAVEQARVAGNIARWSQEKATWLIRKADFMQFHH